MCGTFYSRADDPWDWTTPQNNSLWQKVSKTLFDPCPAGWRVPQGESSPWNAFYNEIREYVSGYWYEDNPGVWWNVSVAFGGPAWYPASGLRSRDRGTFSDIAQRGLYLTTTGSTTPPYFNIEKTKAYMNTAYRTYGFSVRCIRE